MSVRQKIETFLNNNDDYPLLTGFISGLYPAVFYISNNYESVNSGPHLLFFASVFLAIPMLASWIIYKLLGLSDKTKNRRTQFLFLFVLMVTAALFSRVYYMTFKKKALTVLLLVAIPLAIKFAKTYKKIIFFIGILTLVAGLSLAKRIYFSTIGYDAKWLEQPDTIESVQFQTKPNIYVIEPDGYAGEAAMNNSVYHYDNKFYGWLASNGFAVYPNTNSNYPSSLSSNASMFAMKHHHYGRHVSSSIEIPNARKVIVAENPVAKIFNDNGYKTFFIAEDEYFQKNLQTGAFDFYNVRNSEIPYLSVDDLVKKDVFSDLQKQMTAHQNDRQPRFFFVEKLLPHHIHFDGTGKENERKVYLEKVEQVNVWLQKLIAMIGAKDPDAIIVIAADHGGWVGMESFAEFHATRDPELLQSIFGNLIAIKWNGQKPNAKLRSNVNLFRVLFAHLSGDKKLLEKLQPDSAYSYEETTFSGQAVKVIP